MNSAPALARMTAAASVLPTTTLAAVLSHADLQVRTDRKYLIPADAFAEFIELIAPRMSILQIDERRVFRYDSVYFDTPDLLAYRQHATGRRRRFKVRTRTYLDSDTSVLEVKTEGGREETVKDRMPYQYADRHSLTREAYAFVSERVGDYADPSALHTALETAYRRMTLLDFAAGARVTCDAQLTCTGNGRQVHGLDKHILVETKGIGAATDADRALWRLGIRPKSMSKYCLGSALIHPHLPANQWNRVLRTYFNWTPSRAKSSS